MSKNNLTRNTLLLSFSTLINKGLLFIMVPLFSRWLSTDDYGTFDLLCTYISLLIPLITLALSEAVFRLSVDKESKPEKSFYITNGLAVVLVNLFITAIALYLFEALFHWTNTFMFFVLLAGETLDYFLQGFLRGIKKLDIYAFCKMINTIFIAVFSVIFIKVFHMGLDGIMYGYAAGFMVGNITAVICTKFWTYISPAYLTLEGVKALVSYSYVLIPNNISWWVINVSDRSVISIFLGTAANGIYAIAYKIPNLCSSVFGMFNVSWQETATEMIDSGERDSYFNSIYNKMFRVLLSLCGGVLSLNFFFFEFLFDARYYEARLYAPILVSAIIFMALSQFFGGIQISLKQPGANGITTVIGAVTNLIVHIALIKFIGLYAAAVSTIVSNITVMYLRKLRVEKVVKFKLTRSNYSYLLVYLYLFLFSYLSVNLIINLLNVGIASIMFLAVNKELIFKFLHKVRRTSVRRAAL